MFECVYSNTNHTYELCERDFDANSDLLTLIDRRPDEFIVAFRTQQKIYEPLLSISTERP